MTKGLWVPLAEQWAKRICAELGKSVEAIIETGKLLVKAKAELAHGEWERMFSEGMIPFSRSTGNRLMLIAQHPIVSNRAHGHVLPPSWRTLYELTKADDIRLKNALHDGVITPDMPRKAVQDLVVRDQRRAERIARPIVAGTFRLLYVDPPWRYEHVETENRAIENQYPTMSLDEICALVVPAAEDAVLFLWATSPKLDEAMRVISSWRFVYRTCAVWDKEIIGMGYYFRQQHELLLVAARGSLPVPEPSVRPSSVIRARRGAHSEKPAEVYELLEAMYPEFTAVDRVELFARRLRDGWASWGNEEAVA